MNDVLIAEEKKKRDLRVGDIVWCYDEVCIIVRVTISVSGRDIEVLSVISLKTGEPRQTVAHPMSYNIAYVLENMFDDVVLLQESVTLKSK